MTGDRLPRFRPRTRRRLTAGGLAAVALVGLVVAWALSSTSPAVPQGGGGSRTAHTLHAAHIPPTTGHGPPTHGSASSSPSAQAPPIGVYTGPGNVAAAEAAAAQLGGRVPYALDFLPKTSWTAITNPAWLAQQWHGSPFHLVIGVPMLPSSGATLTQGATGEFDHYFQVLAQRLIGDGLGNAILMLGYQPDDDGSSWYVRSPSAARAYVAFWRIIRATMGAVPGADFLFEWDAGDAGTSPVSPAAMYPGNGDVDIVATDAFDYVASDPRTRGHWSTVLDEPYGPAWMESFAAAHHKPMAIAMWGEVPASTGGAGDQPAYATALLRWAAVHRLAMSVLWDDGAMSLASGSFPRTDAALHQAVEPPTGGATAASPGTASQR